MIVVNATGFPIEPQPDAPPSTLFQKASPKMMQRIRRSQHVTFQSALALVGIVNQTLDQIDIDVDDAQLSDELLDAVITNSEFFSEELPTRVGNLKDLIAVCVAGACREAQILGLRHWSDGSGESLEQATDRLRSGLADLIEAVKEEAAEIELEHEGCLSEPGLIALYGLRHHLSGPLMYYS